MPAKIIVSGNGLTGLAERLRPARVRVGILEDQPHEPRGTSLLEDASAQEFGTELIPQRSFLRGTVDEKEGEIRRLLSIGARALVGGEASRREVMEVVGEFVVEAIQARVEAGIPPPNAPSTIVRKGSSTPLIDTGQMIDSIEYEDLSDGS